MFRFVTSFPEFENCLVGGGGGGIRAAQPCLVMLETATATATVAASRQRLSSTHLHYIHANGTQHTAHNTHTHTALTIVYVSVRISDCAKPDPICIRLCCRFNYTPIQAKSGSGIQLRPLLPVEMCALVLVYRCVSVCPSTLSCVSIPENTMTNEIKFKQKQTQMK